MVVKSSSNIRVDFTESKGYEIRLRNYIGVVFTVDMQGKFCIGQTSKARFNIDDFKTRILPELEEGRRYIQTYLSQGTPINEPKTKYISQKDYKPYTIYRDARDRDILYLGKGSLFNTSFSCDRPYNRSGCPYIWGVIQRMEITDFSVDASSRLIVSPKLNAVVYGGIRIETYAGPPVKLVSEIHTLSPFNEILFVNEEGSLDHRYTFRLY